MNQPVLSLAIPTWNRAEIVDKALEIVLPQVEKNKDHIEVILSDNGSTDNTDAVIKKYIRDFPNINIVHNRQSENTGFYGNFKKCRELSNGRYFWLLSDNDHIAYGLIDCIMEVLLSHQPNFVFLKDWKHADKVGPKKSFETKVYDVDKGIEAFNFKTTLISAVIFTNKKTKDDELFKTFKGNTFMGFALFVESLDISKKAVEISGTSLFIKDTKVSFNAFRSFAVDLIACIDYAVNNDILPRETADIFIDEVIKGLTTKHYILFRLTGQLHGFKYEKKEVDDLLDGGFSDYRAYKEVLNPLQTASKPKFLLLVLQKHLFRLAKQRLFR